MIPLFWPPRQSHWRMLWNLHRTLRGRWWGQGPQVDEFERRFAEKFGYEAWQCVMVNSGTAALHLAYVLSGVGAGAEVVVPVLTCTATCHPILLLGGRPVFCDIQRATLTQDPRDMVRRITPKTRALVLVHLGGLVQPWAIEMVARAAESSRAGKSAKVCVIEDCAQSLGVGCGPMRSDFQCYSFQAIKSLTTGDGGMLACRYEADAARARRLRWFSIDRAQKAQRDWQAWDRRGITFDQEEPGYKYQPTDLDAAIGLAAIETFDRNQGHRKLLANEYRRLLYGCDQVELLFHPVRPDEHAEWLFMVKVRGDRDEFAARLAAAGIETNVAHIRNDAFSVFGPLRDDLPNMASIERQYLCLPINNQVTLRDVRHVCETIRRG